MVKKKIRNLLEDNVDIVLEGGSSLISVCFDGLVGQMLPGVVAIRMTYLQKRTEKRLERMITEIEQRQDQIEKLLEGLTNSQLNNISEHYLAPLVDYCSIEKEQNKIAMLVNGFESSLEKPIDNGDYLAYFDVMTQLRVSDIPVLIELLGGEITTPIDPEDMEKMKTYRLNKLNQLGLIEYSLTFDETKIYSINRFGLEFIEFFKQKQAL